MQIDWIILAGCLVILFVPASLIYSPSAKDRLASMTSTRFRVERMLGTWQHWLDFIRAFGGAFLLVNMAFPVNEANERFLPYPYDMALIGGILLIAVMIQTVHYRRSFYFTAPVFFLWGITFVIVGWIPAAFAIVFSVIIARLIDSVEIKLALMAGLVAVVGYFVGGFNLMLILSCVLIVLPIGIALMSMHHLVCYTADLAAK